MSRVVGTGAAGYLGPHVVTALLDRGHDVVAAVRPGSGGRLDPRASVVQADILAPDFDASAWGALPDAVVHLAWKDGFRHNSSVHMSQLSAHFDLLTGLAERGVRGSSPRHHARGSATGRVPSRRRRRPPRCLNTGSRKMPFDGQ